MGQLPSKERTCTTKQAVELRPSSDAVVQLPPLLNIERKEQRWLLRFTHLNEKPVIAACSVSEIKQLTTEHRTVLPIDLAAKVAETVQIRVEDAGGSNLKDWYLQDVRQVAPNQLAFVYLCHGPFEPNIWQRHRNCIGGYTYTASFWDVADSSKREEERVAKWIHESKKDNVVVIFVDYHTRADAEPTLSMQSSSFCVPFMANNKLLAVEIVSHGCVLLCFSHQMLMVSVHDDKNPVRWTSLWRSQDKDVQLYRSFVVPKGSAAAGDAVYLVASEHNQERPNSGCTMHLWTYHLTKGEIRKIGTFHLAVAPHCGPIFPAADTFGFGWYAPDHRSLDRPYRPRYELQEKTALYRLVESDSADQGTRIVCSYLSHPYAHSCVLSAHLNLWLGVSRLICRSDLWSGATNHTHIRELAGWNGSFSHVVDVFAIGYGSLYLMAFEARGDTAHADIRAFSEDKRQVQPGQQSLPRREFFLGGLPEVVKGCCVVDEHWLLLWFSEQCTQVGLVDLRVVSDSLEPHKHEKEKEKDERPRDCYWQTPLVDLAKPPSAVRAKLEAQEKAKEKQRQARREAEEAKDSDDESEAANEGDESE